MSYITHGVADDNEIERRMKMRPTFELKTQKKS